VALQPHCQKMSTTDADRIFHSHGHTCQEIFTVRYGRFVAVAERGYLTRESSVDVRGADLRGRFHRCVDAVVWPRTHADIVAIVRRTTPSSPPLSPPPLSPLLQVRLAALHNVVIIPFGGGTSVSGAGAPPFNNYSLKPVISTPTTTPDPPPQWNALTARAGRSCRSTRTT
jgi:hypothetical protein